MLLPSKERSIFTGNNIMMTFSLTQGKPPSAIPGNPVRTNDVRRRVDQNLISQTKLIYRVHLNMVERRNRVNLKSM